MEADIAVCCRAESGTVLFGVVTRAGCCATCERAIKMTTDWHADDEDEVKVERTNRQDLSKARVEQRAPS